MNLPEPLLRLLSYFDHYGRCGRCRISWKYREPQRIMYDDAGGYAFPLCRQCFDAVDPIIATRYFKRLWVETWDRDLPETREPWQTFLGNAAQLKLERDGRIEAFDPSELREWGYL